MTGLDNGTEYTFIIRAVNGGGPSPASASVRATPVVGRPVSFAGDAASRSVAENTPANQPVGAAVSATSRDGSTLTYSLSGTDASSFDLDASKGRLSTRDALDYETKSSYVVVVSAHDGKDADDNPDTSIDDTITVIITVTNEEEEGAVTLSRGSPVVDTALTASLSDPDGSVSGITWVWERSADQISWTAISGATSESYTPVASDAGSYLRVTASYTDGHGPNKSAQVSTANAAGVEALPPAKPTGVAATTDDGPVTLSWDFPGDASITGYEYHQVAELATLRASDRAAYDSFGRSVAVDGDTIVVGADQDDSRSNGQGYALVFVKPSGGWRNATETARLRASNGAAGEYFGRSVSVDGNTIVVGAYQDDVGAGSAFVFVRPTGGWATASQTAKLTASDRAANDHFGASVAVDGDTIVVGADLDDDSGSNSGSAYVFVKPDVGAWASATQTAKLAASDRAAGDEFGGSVSVDGDTIVVGAYWDDGNGANSGSVYVFVRPSTGWEDATQTAKLRASDRAAGDEFGISVSVDGDTIVVGAFGVDDGRKFNSGSAYVFVTSGWAQVGRSRAGTVEHTVSGLVNGIEHTFSIRAVNAEGLSPASPSVRATPRALPPPAKPTGVAAAAGHEQVTLSWDDPDNANIDYYQYYQTVELAKLAASDGAAEDEFGRSVAVDGDTMVVGAHLDGGDVANSGSAYVFVRPSGGDWSEASQVAKLTASDGASGDRFGRSVSVDGDTIVVGAYWDDGNVANSGSAYVFVRPSTGWEDATQTAKLRASDRAAGDEFGISVSVDGDTVVVGAYQDNPYADSGSAYVFVRPSGGWRNATQTAKLTAFGRTSNDYFGTSVSMDGDTIVVGAYQNGNGAGSAYVFAKPSAGWKTAHETTKLTASDRAAGDEFGRSVSVDGDTIVVGAYQDGNGAGSAYVFVRPSGGWGNASQTAKLWASDRAAGDEFGRSISVDGDTIVVGADQDDVDGTIAGSVYVFVRPSGGWRHATETAKLTTSGGAANDRFGVSVAVDGNTIAVGAHLDDDSGSNSGSAYVFVASGWARVAGSRTGTTKRTVTGLDNEIEHTFSIRAVSDEGPGPASLGVRATPLVLSSPEKPSGVAAAAGHEQVTLSWDDPGNANIDYYQYYQVAELAKLAASDGAAEDEFGRSVAVDGDTMVVGAYLHDGSSANSGSAYVFVRPSGGDWSEASQVAKLTASDGASGDRFGRSVSVDGDIIVVGAYQDDSPNNSGSAYVFIRPSTGWEDTTQTAKLRASDRAEDDEFGRSVSVDGDTIVVGAHRDDLEDANPGSAYVFVRPSRGWSNATQTAKLTASDRAEDDEFGISVSVDGDIIVVGAYEDDSDSGSAYVFVRPSTGWEDSTQTAKLRASHDAGGDRFGISVSVDGDTIVVGAYQDNNPSNSGSAYVFVRPVTGWEDTVQTAILMASDSGANDEFGISVSVDGDTIIVGAHQDDSPSNSGSAYVFVRPSGGDWSEAAQIARLMAFDGAADDYFGFSVSVDGDTVAVGAYGDDGPTNSGSAYVFDVSGWTEIGGSGANTVGRIMAGLDNEIGYTYRVRAVNRQGPSPASDGERATPLAPPPPAKPTGVAAAADDKEVILAWDDPGDFSINHYQYYQVSESAKLAASDGLDGERFGVSVSVDGNTMVVGASSDDDNGANSGSAYVYVKPADGDWSEAMEVAKLTASDGAGGDFFGGSVSVEGDTIVVGASGDDDHRSNSGSAYVFVKTADEDWSEAKEVAKLTASDGRGDDHFGYSVSVDGDTIVVGAHGVSEGRKAQSGAAYVFVRPDGGAWATATETVKLTASDGQGNDYFGYSVSVDGDTIVVEASRDDDNGSNSGSAYVFVKPDGGAWATATEMAKLIASDRASNDEFGSSVSMDGNTIVVGAYGDDGPTNSGSAYVFVRPYRGWGDATETAKLTASDGAARDYFGWSVSVDGDTVVVGAFGDDENGSNSGSAYVFVTPSTGWATATETAKLTASDGAGNDQFGRSVSVAGDTVVAGTYQVDSGGDPGSTYVFETSDWALIEGSGAGTVALTLTGFDVGIEHTFGIRAVNVGGPSRSSASVRATLLGLELSSANVAVLEGSSVSYTVALTVQPSSDVTVSLLSPNAASAAVSPASMTFSASTWNIPQTATVLGVSDNNELDETVTIAHAASGSGYDGVTGTVTVAVEDTTAPDSSDGGGSGGGGSGGNGGGGAVNSSPVFTEGAQTSRQVAENTDAGAGIGAPVSATDADGHTLTYDVSGTDAASFEINSGNGQLIAKAALDYETKSSYMVVVSVSDGRGGSDQIAVVIEVTNVDEVPEFAGSASVMYEENGTDPVETYSATDPEGASIAWSLLGADADKFTISGGELRFSAPPDFETPGDANLDNAYEVEVQATDETRNGYTLFVTVTVTDVDEQGDDAGMVALSTGNPVVGTALTASLSDPDGSVSGVTWVWERSSDQNTWTTIGGATSPSYTPVAGDVGSYLRATATYTDGEGPGKTAQASTANAVVVANSAPTFREGAATTRSIEENKAPGSNIGAAVAATDADPTDTLTYSLSGTDASSFGIVSGSGQLQTKAALDYETKRIYAVTVEVSDDNGGSAIISVTITVTDVADTSSPPGGGGGGAVNRSPVFIEGARTTRQVAENTAAATGIGERVAATDRDGHSLIYSLSGTDVSSFGIVSGSGQLQTKAELDYETKSTYTVTVRVSDGRGGGDTIEVTITVTNVDEAGAVNLDSTQPQVGTTLTASLTDPDGSISGATWMWERSSDQNTWTTIGGATSPGYTPVAGEVGSYLRATATYIDGHGAGKSAQATLENLVEALPQPGVMPVPGAALVEPTEETVITSPEGDVVLTFPANARDDTFQVRTDTTLEHCTADEPPEGDVQLCVRVELFDASGNREDNAVLKEAATLVLELSAGAVAELGGQAALTQLNDEGRVQLLTRDASGDPWTEVAFELSFEEDGRRCSRPPSGDSASSHWS